MKNPNILMKRWASAELTLHEEGSMFGSSIASTQSSRGEVLSDLAQIVLARKF